MIESEPWKICPYFGYSISEFGVKETNAEINNFTLTKFCTIVGVSIDYKVYGDIFTLSDATSGLPRMQYKDKVVRVVP